MEKKTSEVAPKIEEYFHKGEHFSHLSKLRGINQLLIDEEGNYNYLLKCTDGIFSGKFLFINTTPDGELFGSGDPEAIDLTMYIESAELSEKHSEIKFVEAEGRYVLRDCHSHSGTWVRISTAHDIYRQNRRRVYKVADYQFVIEEGIYAL